MKHFVLALLLFSPINSVLAWTDTYTMKKIERMCEWKAGTYASAAINGARGKSLSDSLSGNTLEPNTLRHTIEAYESGKERYGHIKLKDNEFYDISKFIKAFEDACIKDFVPLIGTEYDNPQPQNLNGLNGEEAHFYYHYNPYTN